ncbi:MAG: UTRA domain-containing protein [Parvularculaceae bacterium]
MTDASSRYARASLRLDGEGPLYAQIRRAIAAPIVAGAWRPGEAIPFERDLCARFKTSRMTVNRALTMLANDGLIVRTRRKGSFVAPQPSHHASFEIADIRDEVETEGGRYSYELLTRRLESGVSVGLGDRTLYLVCRHLRDGAPTLLEERWIDLAGAPAAVDQNFADERPNAWLLHNVPWTRAEHQMSAVNAAAAVARLLDLESGAACLVLERRTWRDRTPVTYVKLTYAGPAHKLVGTFEPA